MTAVETIPNDLDAFWMPFTANRAFKANPRMITKAEGIYYYRPDGEKIIDGNAGLWCCNAGHGRQAIVDAVSAQVAELDYAPTFQMGHPKAFELANRLSAMAPSGLDHVFFTNSGSESADTALKIALAYHRAKGEASRTRLIGRERGYHGTNFGGISVGGISNNRKFFGAHLAGVDHLPHTHNLERQAFSKGQPEWGAERADALEDMIALHDASTIAAVIVEPMAGSTGVLIPPQGYLQRLRDICTKHGILLIFDEVITAFGRLGSAFASERFGVIPDIITTAKGLTNGVIPMGAVLVNKSIHDAFMNGPDHMIELFHGYTYSGHPIASAAALATLNIYRDEGLFENAADLESHFEERAHGLRKLPYVKDIRNLGLVCGIELESAPDGAGLRGLEVLNQGYHNHGVYVRISGDILALSPPLMISADQIDQMFDGVERSIQALV